MSEQSQGGMKARIEYILKHNEFVSKCIRGSASLVMRVWGRFVPIDDKMIIFSALSMRYNDSPKAIYEYLIAHPEYTGYKFVWALDDPEGTEIPGPAIKVKADTLQYFKFTLKAKYWVACVNIERSLKYKKKKCLYLNTWHGLSLNHCGNAVPGRKDFDYSNVNFMCYESDYHKEIIMRDFGALEESMIPTGLPRNDTLYKTTPGEVEAIKERLGLPKDKKIILYAPTWRDSTDNGQTYAIKPPITLSYWEEKLKDQFIVLLRTHHYTTRLLGVEFNDFIRDYTSYPVINDLFKVSDILVSDYSSCIADFSILERPIVCFAYDYDQYCKVRGLYLDFENAMPSGVKRTEEEVIEQILTMNVEEESNKTRDMIKNKLTYIGGHATETCVKYLLGNVLS